MRFGKIAFILSLILVFCLATMPDLAAQCAMCKGAPETNLNGGGSSGQGLNNGILYLFLTPYTLVAILGFLWYRNRKKEAIVGDNAV